MILPNCWVETDLGKISQIFSGDGFPTRFQGKSRGEYPFYKVGDISIAVQSGKIFLDKANNYISKEDIKLIKCKTHNLGAVVFAKIGEALKLNRRAILNQSSCIDNNVMGIYVDDKNVKQKYLYYFFLTVRLEKLSRATTVPSIRKTDVEEISFPLPPLNEQHRIVAKIEELFTELDAAVKILKALQQQVKQYRQSALKSAFEGKLTKQSNTWETVKIKDVAETFGGYAFKSKEFINKGKYQVIRMGNIRPGALRLSEKPVFLEEVEENVLSRSLLKANDVIITQTGTKNKRDYGYTTIIQETNLLLNQRIAAIRFNSDYLPPFFLYYSWTDNFKDQFFSNETGNVGQGNVGIKGVTDTSIPFCSILEQSLIVEQIDKHFSIADQTEKTIETSLKKAESLRQSILKRAFEGKLVPQDPNDEPASVLLERIKAEKEKLVAGKKKK